MKTQFTESEHCTSRVHCAACRGEDDSFRNSLMQSFDWDGECPYGLTLDNIPERSVAPKMPSVPQQVLNLTQAVGRVIKGIVSGEQIIADEDTRKERISICEGCEFLSGSRCSKCGCVTAKKVALQTEHCPIKKW
jgi:hypothetical protein